VDALGRYFVPGPVAVHPDVLAEMTRPMFSHRSAAGEELFARVQPGLRAIFGTERTVYVFTTSGTGAVEAGVRALPPGRVLALVNGAFSGRFARMAEACGHAVDRMELAWGGVHDPAAVRDRLAGADYAAVTVVHSETSTGALQPLAELARAAGEVPLLVDSVSGAGGTPVAFDALGLAWACTGSQKALALPPGLAFGVASPLLLERAARASGRGLYLDIAAYEKRQPPYTPALPLVHALARQLERIAAEGLDARFARHAAMARRAWTWAEETGLEVLAPPGARSPTVTCLRLPAELPGPEFVRRVAQQGYTVGGGYGQLKETTFRIGHMGEQTVETLEGLLAACRAALGR